jgi:hypothetical protein
VNINGAQAEWAVRRVDLQFVQLPTHSPVAQEKSFTDC